MKRQIGIATATAAFLAASLAAAAQTPPPTTPQTPPSRTSSADTVTVTGCVQPSSTASSSTSSTATSSTASSSMSASYILANATMGPSSPGTTTGTTGTTSSTASSSAGKTYNLMGSDSDLKKHVGHKVEVTGKLESSSSESPTATTGAASRDPNANAPKLQVSSVKMISADCSAK